MIEFIEKIAQSYQVNPADLLSKNRKTPLPAARHHFFGVAYAGGWKQKQIADLFNVSQSAISQGISHYFQTAKP